MDSIPVGLLGWVTDFDIVIVRFFAESRWNGQEAWWSGGILCEDCCKQRGGWMDEWVNEWVDGWADGKVGVG